ncbi:MAG: V-type ATP synthase subunit F [Thermoplasmatota archaeon]
MNEGMQIAVIGDADTVALFKLAGVSRAVVADDDVAAQFDSLVTEEDVGVIIVTERIAQSIIKKITQIKLQKELPVIIEVPDKQGELEGREDSVDQLIRRAVGVEI